MSDLPRQELLEAVDGMLSDVPEHIVQIGVRIDAVQAARTDQTV